MAPASSIRCNSARQAHCMQPCRHGMQSLPAARLPQVLLGPAPHAAELVGRRGPHVLRASATEVQQSPEVAIASLPGAQGGRFAKGRSCFLEQHRICGYEVGADQRASIVSIANILQEVAANHAVCMWGRCEDGFAGLPGEFSSTAFVMTSILIRMDDYPKWGDMVEVETWFNTEGRLLWRRDWQLRNTATGQLLGTGTSLWVPFDLEKRRPTRVPEDLKARYMALSPKPPRFALPDAMSRGKLPDLPATPEIEGAQQMARRSDVDMNGHINNVTYLAWALETVPDDVYSSHTLHEVELEFRAECTAGQCVESVANPLESPLALTNGHSHLTPRQYLHLVRRCDDGGCTELVRARTAWLPRQ